MPRLKRLLGDAPAGATAEQLLASSMYSQEMRVQRQKAAALCSASLMDVATLEARQMTASSAIGSALEQVQSCSIEQCVDAALMVTTGGNQVLFIVRDPKLVTKRLAAAVSSADATMTTEVAAECLHRVRFRPCRSIYELLSELDLVRQSWQERQEGVGPQLQLVALGPLCDLFSNFQTASGMTVTGAGLKRMVELAVKQLRATTSIHVSVMEVELQ